MHDWDSKISNSGVLGKILNVGIYFRKLLQEVLWIVNFLSETKKRKEKIKQRLWDKGEGTGTLL